MVEFIITLRQKYLRNFSLCVGLQTYFTTCKFTCVFCLFLFTLFSLVFFFTVLSLTPNTNRVFFFVWETSNKPCARYFSSCYNKCSTIFTPKHRWYLKTKQSEQRDCWMSTQHHWSPNLARCFAATIWSSLQLHLLTYLYQELRGVRKPRLKKESMNDL